MSSQLPPQPPSTSDKASTRKMGIGMMAVAWALVFLMMIVFFDDLLGKQHNPNQHPDSLTGDSGVIEVVLTPNQQHHYVVNGMINGKKITFLLDTGATDVVIPAALAKQLTLKQGAKQLASTANGTVTVYNTQLDTLSIGNITLDNIRASINPGMQQNVVLLGMSALKQIEFAQRGEQLILRQYP